MKRPSVHPLIVLVTLVVITLVTLLSFDETQTARYFDPPMLVIISLAYASAALMMLSRTGWRRWTVLSSGLLATMLGDALLYTYILMPRLGVELPFREERLALIRVFLVVGGPFVLAGLIREEFRAFQDRRGREATTVEQAATEIRHTAEDLKQGVRTKRQDERETGLDLRADEADQGGKDQDLRGWDQSRESLRQDVQRHDLDDREEKGQP